MSRRTRSLSDALADLPDLSDKIVKSDDRYCGAGAFSDVYKRQYDSGAGLVEVAVKSFRFPFTLGEGKTEGDSKDSRDNSIRKMIRRELGIWRRLDHPNIVPFLGIAYGFGSPGHASLVGVWMANGTLQQFLEKHDDRLNVAHKLQLLSDIANGLSYLHSFPIIHGDLSPNNVLVDRKYSARLTDFGYASMVGDIPEFSRYLQMSTMRPGTIRWAAPEHFTVDREAAKLTAKSDVYSFGNIALLALSGSHPWSEVRHDGAVIVQLSRGNKPARPSSHPINDQHWELIERCWSPIDDRPCSPNIVSSLQQLLCTLPPSVPLVDFFHTPVDASDTPSSSSIVVPTSGHSRRQNDPTALKSDLLEAVLKPLFLYPSPQDLLVTRSKAYLTQGLCTEALRDANKAIEVDPSSPWGYERKHAALHQAKHYQDAVDAFETMLSKISQSPDEGIYALRRNYISPADTKDAIRRAVQDTLRDSPRMLIHTGSGRLCDKFDQAASFWSGTAFNKLVSSMTTNIDYVHIKQEVQDYYCYGMLSHKWVNNEPLFEQVLRVPVYDPGDFPAYHKLKMFCMIVRDAGLHWAWSDTCCINRADIVVLQEALVSMFRWYQNSSLTVVFLFDVRSPSRRGDLTKSIWNSRAWTFQEYHASKVVRFYTKDWEPYLNLGIRNHKESSEIISEMEEATGVSARALIAIQPGIDDIREKLFLASTRKTTFPEDAAYSLLGIFSMSLPVVYGEGDHALGRLLAQVLTSSGDTSILAWTGRCGSFNSCLPTSISVYKELIPLHIPSAVRGAELGKIIATLRTSTVNPALVVQLYDKLQDLPLPSLVDRRLKLPCLIFKLGAVSRNAGDRVFRAQTDGLGIVEIETNEDLSRWGPLYLIHPWIDFLLDRHPIDKVVDAIPEENSDDQSILSGERPSSTAPSTIPAVPLKKRLTRFASRFVPPFGELIAPRVKDADSLPPPSTVSQQDKRKLAFQTLARLRQPFGALLLAQSPSWVMGHERLAAQTLITAKLEEVTPAVLNQLVSSVRVLDVL